MCIRLLALATTTILFTGAAAAQRRLGPKDRETILDAKLDPGFASTKLSRLIFLPISNELDYPEGAMILCEVFIAAMRQKHADITIVSPEETKKLIREHGLSEEYRRFSGNYLTSGVATLPFLEALGRVQAVDGILLGRIHAFGVVKRTRDVLGVRWSRNRALVGMDLTLLRGKDGRQLWWGAHAVEGDKNETVRDLAKIVGDVLATYFGRVPY